MRALVGMIRCPRYKSSPMELKRDAADFYKT
jgi:hypothetical protein